MLNQRRGSVRAPPAAAAAEAEAKPSPLRVHRCSCVWRPPPPPRGHCPRQAAAGCLLGATHQPLMTSPTPRRKVKGLEPRVWSNTFLVVARRPMYLTATLLPACVCGGGGGQRVERRRQGAGEGSCLPTFRACHLDASQPASSSGSPPPTQSAHLGQLAVRAPKAGVVDLETVLKAPHIGLPAGAAGRRRRRRGARACRHRHTHARAMS